MMKPEPYRGIVEIKINEDSEEKAVAYLEFLLADFFANRTNFEYEIVAVVPPGESAMIISVPEDGELPFGEFTVIDPEDEEDEEDGDPMDYDWDDPDESDDLDSDGDVVEEVPGGFSGSVVVETRTGGQ